MLDKNKMWMHSGTSSGGTTTKLSDDGSGSAFTNIADDIRAVMAVTEAANKMTPFVYGKTRIPLNVPTYGSAEVIEALDSLMSTWVTMGKKVKTFEEMFAKYTGKAHGVMTNSGSSANLLALSLLDLKPGDEVITPALTWATTVFPISQVGATPVLVDVERDSYNISPRAIEKVITPKTKAIMLVHLLGNPCNMSAIMDMATRLKIKVIEDSCEAHGAEYGDKKVGSFGDIATFSFFFSHHISTIEGGMVLVNDPQYLDQLRSMRAHGWVREMTTRDTIAAQNPDVDSRFLFAYPGYNFRPTEIGGAFGIHQLPKLEGFVKYRRELAQHFNTAFAPYEKWLTLPHETIGTRHSYFSYPITVKEGAPFTKKQLQAFLEACGVETRQIESGNMAQQPAMKRLHYRAAPIPNAEYIHKNGFFFGLHTGIGTEEKEAITAYVHEFMRGKGL